MSEHATAVDQHIKTADPAFGRRGGTRDGHLLRLGQLQGQPVAAAQGGGRGFVLDAPAVSTAAASGITYMSIFFIAP